MHVAVRPCVVHLVRASNGIEPFVAFLDSYDAHPAGLPHELVIALKGFRVRSDADPYLLLAGERVSEAMFVEDVGFDLTAYFVIADRLRRARYCFLNSFTEILADDWLALMDAAFNEPAVGLVGATGSYTSIGSYLRFHLGLGGAYARVFDDRPQTQVVMERIGSLRDTATSSPRSWLGGKLAAVAQMPGQALWFGAFPNPHVRTNAFMVGGETCMQLEIRRLRTKVDAYRLESGRASITRQVERLGLRAVLVTRDGTVHDVTTWAASGAFWQRNQESLLIADNQTRVYERGDADVRLFLSRYAWGELADPS